MLTDAVTKCGRDSERRLYMYGISSNRCPKCQARLRGDNSTCINCHYSHKTLRSSKPHHCFPIDSASGKHFVEAAWSDEFTEKVRTVYRLRLHNKMQADEAKTKSTDQQPSAVVNGAVDQPVSSNGASSTATAPMTPTTDNEVAGASSVSTATVPPTTGAQDQSRKRQLPGVDDGRNNKVIRASESLRSDGKPSVPTDGMSLYDRVRAMHDMRVKAAQFNVPQARSPKANLNHILSQRTDERTHQKREQEERAKREANHKLQQQELYRQQEQARIEQLKKRQQHEQEQAAKRRQQEERQRQELQKQQEVQRLQAEQCRHEEQQQQQQPDFSDAMVPHRMTAGAGEGRFSPTTPMSTRVRQNPSKSGEDDELRAIWVSDYDNVNALVMQLDVEITRRTEEGHEFVHRSNNITIPEQLKIQINNLRAQRDAALKKRFESVVRVLIFSEAVRSFAQQSEHANIWSDVPAVLTSSHKKCAELAAEVREFECEAQKLREGIDEAVSSGNPAQMQNVARLGALIADLEQKIRTSNGERDKQFIFMFQFSDTLRNMVRAEWSYYAVNVQGDLVKKNDT
ncbi:uncharacterized protein PITG_03883 [Phytophthora infestans T30-4]|uniref:Uncharacterized protein n=1 Tax=Phytophthora infestans (strain T30-4) TaxID=403677 RepID=D0MYS5_PHYIT|nr:uncharacterized protein PITG_03883 [Phytophthora infestans T30-4]EEY66323.1 conserved hypothetical protein [Phytophthora infestans T30-4]|eukprot:XP_002906922.1 conserved hypothetical protein [Phytophthora infestans T30-4]